MSGWGPMTASRSKRSSTTGLEQAFELSLFSGLASPRPHPQQERYSSYIIVLLHSGKHSIPGIGRVGGGADKEVKASLPPPKGTGSQALGLP